MSGRGTDSRTTYLAGHKARDCQGAPGGTPRLPYSKRRFHPIALRWILRTVLPLFRAINDAVTGHIEKLSTIMGNLVEEAGGEQYRCTQCASFGPKVSEY